MKIGYGYRKHTVDLQAAGAERVYIDTDSARPRRAEMMRRGLRAGDTLVLLYLRDLGGSPVADTVWRGKVEALGVTIKIVRPVNVRPVGRPRKFQPTPEEDAAIRAIWLDGLETEKRRLQRIADYKRQTVGKGALVWRYGTPTNPKPPKS